MTELASLGARRLFGRAFLLLGAALWFLLSGSPASHADEGAVPGDTANVAEAVEQVVAPVVKAAEPAVQPAVEQVASPVVKTADPTVQPGVKTVQPVVAPVAKAVQPALEPVVAPVVKTVQPATNSKSPVGSGPSHLEIVGSRDSGHSSNVDDLHEGAGPPSAGAKEQATDRRRDPTGDTGYDLAPRTAGRSALLGERVIGDRYALALLNSTPRIADSDGRSARVDATESDIEASRGDDGPRWATDRLEATPAAGGERPSPNVGGGSTLVSRVLITEDCALPTLSAQDADRIVGKRAEAPEHTPD